MLIMGSMQQQTTHDVLPRLVLLVAGLLLPLLLPQAPQLAAGFFGPLAVMLLVAGTLVPMRLVFSASALFAAGSVWTLVMMTQATSEQLPSRLDKCRWQVEGKVVGLPRSYPRRLSFVLEAKSGHWVECPKRLHVQPQDWQVAGKKLRLSLYLGTKAGPNRPASGGGMPVLTAGDRLDALVQLRAPAGLANPVLDNSEEYFVRTQLAATGYVRALNQVQASSGGLDDWRQQVSDWLTGLPMLTEGRWLSALLVGDQRSLQDADWSLLRKTGTVHLMVVSGLHISLAAGLGWLFGWLLAVAIGGRRHHLGLLFALLVAGLYAFATGLGLPAQRALIMVAIFAGTSLLHRQIPLSHRYLYTLIAVLISAPLAPLGPGFWLSFAAVLILLLLVPEAKKSSSGRLRVWLIGLVKAQIALTMMLVPLLIQIQGQIHFIAPLVNLLAVPLLSFALLPALLVAAPLDGFLALLGSETPLFLHLPDVLVRVLHAGLDLAASFKASWQLHSGWAWLASLVVPLVWLPMPGILRTAALLLWLLLVFFATPVANTDFRLVVLDVGQGLSAFIQTGDQAVVYDAGPSYSAGSDSARQVIVPTLQHYGVRKITTLIVSHGDHDHAGGVASLAMLMPPERIIAGQPQRLPATVSAEPCRRFTWSQGEVQFTVMLAPIKRQRPNTFSCVMIARVGDQTILFPGDLPARGELSLLPTLDNEHIDVLVASHHGSQDASHPDFLQAIQPEVVLYTTGYHNRYGHPARASCENARRAGAKLYNTAYQGAVEIGLNDDGLLEVEKLHRCSQKRWWQRHHPLACETDLGYLGTCPDDQ